MPQRCRAAPCARRADAALRLPEWRQLLADFGCDILLARLETLKAKATRHRKLDHDQDEQQ
jgi:hypothetical protein